MPPWIYKVTATDLNCPDASFVHFGGNGTLDSAISNTTEKEKSPNHACDYCIYPITITCVSFAFCVVYLLMLVVAYAGVSVKIGSQKLLSRLRLLLLLYTVLVPLLVCVQAVLVIPMLDMVAIQVIWICTYLISGLVLGGGVLLFSVLHMLDTSRAIKNKKAQAAHRNASLSEGGIELSLTECYHDSNRDSFYEERSNGFK